MKNMKKVLFFALLLVILGVASVSAQVRIGGDGEPNEAAVLDLNVDNDTDGTKGLALPRVSLASTDDKLGYTDLLEGMLVYNTKADIIGGSGIGIYFWDGTGWVAVDYFGSSRPGYVKWTHVITLPLAGITAPANSAVVLAAAGVRNGDHCTISTATIVYVIALFDAVRIQSYESSNATFTGQSLICRRLQMQ